MLSLTTSYFLRSAWKFDHIFFIFFSKTQFNSRALLGHWLFKHTCFQLENELRKNVQRAPIILAPFQTFCNSSKALNINKRKIIRSLTTSYFSHLPGSLTTSSLSSSAKHNLTVEHYWDTTFRSIHVFSEKTNHEKIYSELPLSQLFFNYLIKVAGL